LVDVDFLVFIVCMCFMLRNKRMMMMIRHVIQQLNFTKHASK